MASTRSAAAVPEVALPSGNAGPMPVIVLGTAVFQVPQEVTKDAVLTAIELGYRHFDTAYMYATEKPLGEGVAARPRQVPGGGVHHLQAVEPSRSASPQIYLRGERLRSTRRSTKHREKRSETAPLRKQTDPEYLDLYLIHFPICIKRGPYTFPAKREDALPFDFKGVWQAMEECQRLGLARAIGVSNFTTKHLDKMLPFATITPAVNQVEVNPVCHQQKLRTYCAEKGIHVQAYGPLGGQDWTGEGNPVLESQVLAEIAKARGKSVARVSLRWVYEQGASFVFKTYNKERLKENLEIFDWELTDEDRLKISQIPQKKLTGAAFMFLPEGEFTSVDVSEINFAEE
ncbi:Non-functional NADPH-dependent codeinone reductase 2 [Dichanthelium oligosanthes]|uniref:Non-functional NADPH-dependent codeinone reductase 2 n=1 Tax=Dichanthelium oligosanthes TaxID=888268 RepID=A0A1E5WKE2_9POAL|nr:Non-functional NADPH-dependent codeinone reductase 2 [Dichanthelium oligosanthes]